MSHDNSDTVSGEKTRNMVMNSPEMNTTFLGVTPGRGGRKDIGIPDRYRNLNVLVPGAIGEGKTQATVHAVLSDIRKGNGVLAAGPKGDFINEILAKVPEDRLDDVLYINPRFNPALNVLEPVAENRLPDEVLANQKAMITDELVQLFEQRSENFGGRYANIFKALLRAHLQLNIEEGESNTLMDVYQCVRSDDREDQLERLKSKISDPILRDDLDFAKELNDSDLDPIAHRIREFATETVRPMIAAEESSVDFVEVVDEGNIVLVEVQKGELGLDVAQSTVSIVLSKLWSAIQSQVVKPEEERENFYLYLDEFQNFGTSDSVLSTMLTEGREYGLGCWLVTQLLNREEISRDFRETVLTNTQSKLVFRTESSDAKQLADSLNGVDRERLDNLNSYNAFLQVPSKGSRPNADRVETYPPWNPDRSREEVEELKEELAVGSDTGSVGFEAEAVDETGESVTAGSSLHDTVLDAASTRLEELPNVQSVAITEQGEGVSKPDGIVFYESGQKAYVEVELSSLSKPAKVLTNLRRADEAGAECIFAVQEGDRDRLENIVEDPVNRSGDEHEDDDGSFSYYRDGDGGEYDEIGFVDDADYQVLEITEEEVMAVQHDLEDLCPFIDERPKEKLEEDNGCLARRDDGYCLELERECVLDYQ